MTTNKELEKEVEELKNFPVKLSWKQIENKEDIVPNVKDFTEKQSKALENLIDELEKMSKNLGIVKVPPIPMTTVIWKDNPFKKYIRKKKYLTFSKKK